MSKGTIKQLMDRGYGFIKTEQEEDLFFHSTSLEGVEFNSLSEGQAVEYERGQGRDGRPAAVKVRLAEAPVEDAEAPAEDAAGESEDAGESKDADESEDAGSKSKEAGESEEAAGDSDS